MTLTVSLALWKMQVTDMTTTESDNNGWTTGYNGCANYETWNVALWSGVDSALYGEARRFARTSLNHGSLYERFIAYCPQDISGQTTGDGVSWNDINLDIAELDEYIKELGE